MLSPFRRGFMDPRGELNRMFEDMWGAPERRGEERSMPWAPATDVVTRDSDLVLRMELPGVNKDDVDIRLSNGVLTVSGERKEERERTSGKVIIPVRSGAAPSSAA